MNKTTLQTIISEIVAVELKTKKEIRLLPIAEMYNQYDHRYFLQKARDYIYFGEDDNYLNSKEVK